MKRRIFPVGSVLSALTLALVLGCGGGSTEIPEAMDIPGFIDHADAVKIEGWAWDRADTSKSVSVDIYVDDKKVATVNADKPATKLPRKGKYGFSWPTPKDLKDGMKEGKEYKIHAIIASTGEKLLVPDGDFKILKAKD